jgi:haloalkane dehalogenase
MANRRSLSRGIHRHYLEALRGRERRRGTYALALALVGEDAYYGRLWEARRVLRSRPMAIVWGRRDPVLRPAHLQRWREAFPDAEVQELPDCGHFVAEEDPAAVAAAVRMIPSRMP